MGVSCYKKIKWGQAKVPPTGDLSSRPGPDGERKESGPPLVINKKSRKG